MDIDIDVDIAIDVDIDVDTHLAIVKPKGTARIWGSLCWQAQPLGEDSKGNFVGQAAAAPRAEEPCLWEWRTCIEGG